jgi:quinol monooxygenase YgiN
MAGISKTVVSLQPGKMEEVTKLIDSQSELVTALDGIIGFAVAVTGEDEITIIGVYESSQNARDASDTVQKVFSDMAPFMASPPDRGVYSGVWFPAK